jgi:mono/diheme cytochrome c family protein
MKTLAAASLALLTFSTTVALAADPKAGGAAYDKSCKGCHGATGIANPAIAKMMGVTIPDLGSAAVQGLGDADLVKVVNEGKGKMKPIKTLSASPEDVVAFVRTLKK